jgi:2,3-bisphosphoglycerate-independent phosphoglycerate mutase
MDRYGADWAMVERGYWCHTHGEGRPFTSARKAVETMYAESDDGDQYLDRFVVVDHEGDPVGAMTDGDAVVLFNFRGDRAIEISQAYEDPDFGHFDRGNHPDLLYAGMLQYDGDLLVPTNHLVAPPSIDRTLGEYLCATGLQELRSERDPEVRPRHLLLERQPKRATSTKHSRPTSRSRQTGSSPTQRPR